MSIELLPYDTGRCSLQSLLDSDRASSESPALRAGSERITRSKRPPSPRRIAANRRNARKSTGPKTPQGKSRASRNALKHGLCADTAIPSCEDLPTFSIFLEELREELQPVTILQKTLFPQIANLIWRLRRLPEAQAHLFDEELCKTDVGKDERLTASQLLARRFSEDSSNAFAMLGRYERAMQNTLLRLLSKFHYLKKHHPYTPYDPDEPPVPTEGSRPAAPSREAMRIQEETFKRREQELPLHVPPRGEYEAIVDRTIAIMEEQKRTQTKPTANREIAPKSPKCRDCHRTPVTKRTQRRVGPSPGRTGRDAPATRPC